MQLNSPMLCRHDEHHFHWGINRFCSNTWEVFVLETSIISTAHPSHQPSDHLHHFFQVHQITITITSHHYHYYHPHRPITGILRLWNCLFQGTPRSISPSLLCTVLFRRCIYHLKKESLHWITKPIYSWLTGFQVMAPSEPLSRPLISAISSWSNSKS